jgi:hypothetical protein
VKTTLALALGLAVTVAPLAARADGQYQTIDSVNRRNQTYLYFSGVLVGASASTADVYDLNSAAPQADGCERDMLLMLTHPGRYLLTVNFSTGCTLAAKTN